MSTYLEFFMNELNAGFLKKKDEVVKEALIRAGFDPENTEFIREHMQLVKIPFDNFEHFWYHFGQPDAVRIISVGPPVFDSGLRAGKLTTDIVKHTISAQYY